MKQAGMMLVCTCAVLLVGVIMSYCLLGPAAPLPPVRAAPADMEEVVTATERDTHAGDRAALYPALFVCHGGGPMPVLGDRLHVEMVQKWKAHMQAIIAKHGKPSAVAVVSAHFNTKEPTFGAAANPAMYYDYGGFPKEAYTLRYDAPGAPALAAEMASALEKHGIPSHIDATRPYDHGVFVPLMMMMPDADVPVVPISVLNSDDPEAHVRMGMALRPFRERGVFFLGSGSSMHNFKYFAYPGAGKAFGDALTDALQTDGDGHTSAERLQAMLNVAHMRGFSQAQPSGAHEHLMPLLTLFGTANATAAKEVASVPFMLANVRHYLFEN